MADPVGERTGQDDDLVVFDQNTEIIKLCMQGEYNISDICNYYIVLQIIILYFKNYMSWS